MVYEVFFCCHFSVSMFHPTHPLPWFLKAFKGTSIKIRTFVMGTRQARANRIVFTVYRICT